MTSASPDLCPCGLGEPYGQCCGRFHRGASAAPTATQLMRSRYSAFAMRDADYLLRTWHPRTRPQSLDFDPAVEWVRLTVIATTAGGLLDSEGVVEFVAQYRQGGARGRQHEVSRFTRIDGTWVYVNGES